MEVAFYRVWDEASTRYTVVGVTYKDFKGDYGGDILVTLMVGGKGQSMFLNFDSEVSAVFLCEQLPGLKRGDADILVKQLNKMLTRKVINDGQNT